MLFKSLNRYTVLLRLSGNFISFLSRIVTTLTRQRMNNQDLLKLNNGLSIHVQLLLRMIRHDGTVIR